MYNSKMDFPSADDFKAETIVSRQQAMKWKDVPTGVYKIAETHLINTKYGKSLILTLEDSSNIRIKCFTPVSMVEKYLSYYRFIRVYDIENDFRPYNFL